MLVNGKAFTRSFFLPLSAFFLGACQIGCTEHDPSPTSRLIRKLNEGDYQARMEAFSALRKLGATARPAIPTLMKMLEDSDSITRSSAAETLGAIGPDAKSAIPSLIFRLKDKDKLVRGSSAEALSKIGVKEGKIISPVQNAMLAEPDPYTRIEIAESLVELDPESEVAIATVINVLQKGREPGERFSAAASFRTMNYSMIKRKKNNSKIKLAIPALIIALKDNDARVRKEASSVLGNICEESDRVVPALIDRLNDESYRVRLFSAQSLGEFGPEAKAAIPALTRALNDPNDRVRICAAQSLRQIRTSQEKGGQKALEDHTEKVKVEMQRIEKIGR